MNKIKPEYILQRNGELLTSTLDEQIVMMHVYDGNYYSLNNIGTRIWQILETPLTFNELVIKLVDEFEVSKEQCVDDITPFINELIEKQILSLVSND